MRLHSPLPIANRDILQNQTLHVLGKNVLIPADASVKIDLPATHCHPNYWGPDPESFRPNRWIVESKKPHEGSDQPSESLAAPKPGTFLPWLGGPRECPGKKFSQIEFARVLVTLFRGSNRVRIVPEAGESPMQARVRALKVVEEAQVEFVLNMQNCHTIGMDWYIKT